MILESQLQEIERMFLKEIKLAQKNISPTNNQIFNNSRKKRIELINWILDKATSDDEDIMTGQRLVDIINDRLEIKKMI